MEIDGTMKQSIVQFYQWMSSLVSPWMIMMQAGPKFAQKVPTMLSFVLRHWKVNVWSGI